MEDKYIRLLKMAKADFDFLAVLFNPLEKGSSFYAQSI